MKTLLVIECQSTIDWPHIFSESSLFGEEVKVVQAEFPDVVVTSYPDSGVVVDIRNKGTFTIDFVLLRSVTRCSLSLLSHSLFLSLSLLPSLPPNNSLLISSLSNPIFCSDVSMDKTVAIFSLD
jgi:hypothetical protein